MKYFKDSQHVTLDGKPLVVIYNSSGILFYAWNEMGEGGNLVPKKDDPEGEYLKVVEKVVSGR